MPVENFCHIRFTTVTKSCLLLYFTIERLLLKNQIIVQYVNKILFFVFVGIFTLIKIKVIVVIEGIHGSK